VGFREADKQLWGKIMWPIILAAVLLLTIIMFLVKISGRDD
jgi:hypothetical protein